MDAFSLPKILMLLFCLVLAACDGNPWNNPYPVYETKQNIRYSSFNAPPKTLDPAKAYSADEIAFIAQIYEPPLQYHYLKRPYTLIPLTTSAMPELVYTDDNGKQVPADSPDSSVAYSVYTLRIKPGIFYQPHPAFARDAQGRYLYHAISATSTDQTKSLSDFTKTGSRELVADDYVYEIKRLAKPGVNSPIYSLMSTKIVGLADYSKQLVQLAKQKPKQYIDLRNYPLSGASVIDRYTYKVIIKGKYPQFLYWLSMSFFAPVPWEADVFYSQPRMKTNNINFDWYPIGTGPYYLIENNPNRKMVLAKNPFFHPEYFPTEGEPSDVSNGYLKNAGKRLPFLDKAIYTLEKESIPRWNKFLQGYYDQSTISSDSFDQAIQMDSAGNPYLTPELKSKGVYLQTTVGLGLSYLGFNMLDDTVGGYSERARKLRQAISIAVNFDEYIAIFLNGRGIPAQGPIPPGIFGYIGGEQGINAYVYRWHDQRPERLSISVAKKLMTAAGYPRGIDPRTGNPLILNFDATTTSGPDEKALFDWLREQFAKLGIQLNIRATEYNRFQEMVRTGQAQMFLWAWLADYPDPENFLFLLYGPNGKAKHGGENATNYDNPAFNQLFNQMKNMPDGPMRQQIIDKMVAIVRADAPWAWGVNPKTFLLNQPWNTRTKLTDLNNNTLKYQSVNSQLREKSQVQWNKPIIWPLVVIMLFSLIVFIPVIIRYRQKEHQSIKPPRKK